MFLTVAVFGLGMAIFTMVMGNAFAAFPVMAAAIGVPLVIQGYGGDPAVVGAVGMLAGFCGTLMTPMAANFNLVPAALLELKDQYGVIRAQVATALPLLADQHPADLLAGVPMKLDAEMAARLARIALGHVTKEYPHKLDHVLGGDEDVLPPRVLHPIFYGSFDWHSCVHGWWTLLTLRRLFPEMLKRRRSRRWPTTAFTEAKIAVEMAYLDRPLSGGFERPYGWAWLLALHLEASRHPINEWATSSNPSPAPSPRGSALFDHPHLPDPHRHPFQYGVRFVPRERMGEAIRPRPRGGDAHARRRDGLAEIEIARRGSRAATNSCRRR